MTKEALKKQIEKNVKTEFDSVIFYTTMTLVFIGIIMVFSASFVQSSFKHHDAYYFLKRNVIYAILGFICMITISNVDYKVWKKNTKPIGIVSIILLILVLTPLGIKANGARRWLGVGAFTIQPAEIAKFATIIITAKLIEKKYENIKSFRKGLIPLMLVPLLFFTLIMGQPNMSTAGTIILVTFVMIFVAGMSMKIVGFMFGSGIALFLALGLTSEYRLKRILSFLDPFQDPLGNGYQVIQGLYALGSGGLFGMGLGKSQQKWFYIPEPQNDFIFAIIGEELGLIGCAVVIMLFVILVYRCVRIALKCDNIFACMVVIGIGAQIGIQAALNIAVATSSMPVTGVALPFISYGGTSLVIFMSAIGIVLNISKHVKIN
ncbi:MULTISPECIES: stage V sporulation protein E [Romboutsia]|uniref:Probable peptidoglycan glycosyltransferase FtsW n=1 Tax=Romboutsia hominis TaxID=1507512 RepID=A0A2P2BTZ9_9FIRM|nr:MULTISPECIES: stage V sporulation protein E [Romboutsia]MDB8789430.1 stage V sporulation protein E [Romboutsia sp. 1001216sp1]MDB8801996.1 stage V sporulation protein E [Romboutsia sp. 1001216sp1]MDB8804628.1 stage V sporulation protein E [Romboutsia sp. 1001216sp1]MDB8806448.1 stage V sporulation protein E [Romboutsia sp. 1001216sp1]MDB8810276.1 stage V sporulation protein E [Romboutsia sp. 1001216sp1]